MENRRHRFPATESLHSGQYLDQTLAVFEERIPADPDRHTKFEGTVHRLPDQSDGLLTPQKRVNASTRSETTSEPRKVALDTQSKLAKAARRWWSSLPPKEKARMAKSYGFST